VTLLRRLSPRVRGTLLCLAAAAGFGASPLLARAGEDAGVGVVALLGARFAIAAAILWVLVLRRGPLPSGRAASRGLALGLLVYAPEAGLYFAALTRMDAAPAAMLVALYPALVAVGAIALGRERMSRRLGLALLAALAGVALVLLGGGGVGSVDGLGVGRARGAATASTSSPRRTRSPGSGPSRWPRSSARAARSPSAASTPRRAASRSRSPGAAGSSPGRSPSSPR
jgi:drug/metabolite transporter (DMT)-like permease